MIFTTKAASLIYLPNNVKITQKQTAQEQTAQGQKKKEISIDEQREVCREKMYSDPNYGNNCIIRFKNPFNNVLKKNEDLRGIDIFISNDLFVIDLNNMIKYSIKICFDCI